MKRNKGGIVKSKISKLQNERRCRVYIVRENRWLQTTSRRKEKGPLLWEPRWSMVNNPGSYLGMFKFLLYKLSLLGESRRPDVESWLLFTTGMGRIVEFQTTWFTFLRHHSWLCWSDWMWDSDKPVQHMNAKCLKT